MVTYKQRRFEHDFMFQADVINALFYFYVLLFTGSLIGLFAGMRLFYKGLQQKNDALLRKAKFILLFAIIAMVCIAIVSFFVTGKLPVD